MSIYKNQDWIEHFDPDDPLYDPHDDRPTDGVDFLHLWDELPDAACGPILIECSLSGATVAAA